MYGKRVGLRTLIGCTLSDIDGMEEGNDHIRFTLTDGRRFEMYHEQCCREDVYIADVCGSVQNLIGSPLTMAEDASSENADDAAPEGWQPDKHTDSYTWTFYKFATVKGYVTLRWYGTSNGCYSERVDCIWVKNPEAAE